MPAFGALSCNVRREIVVLPAGIGEWGGKFIAPNPQRANLD
jgi:hypothetical protein